MHPSRSKVQKISSKGLSVGTWTPAEDSRLTEAVAKHGPRWVLVAGDVGSRNGDQCAKRWNENLNPELDHSPWCPVEDRALLHLVELYGHKWKFIANRFFEKRSPLSLKNRNSYLERRQRREEQQGRSAQRSGQQSPFNPLTPTALTMSDAPINIPATFPLGPHEYPFGDGSSHSSSPSMTGTEMARLQSRCSSSTDMAEFMGSMSAMKAAGESPTPDQGGDMMMVAHPPLQNNNNHIGHMAEQVDWHRFMDTLDPFGHPTGEENIIRILGTNSDGIALPMLDANGPIMAHTQPYGASTGIELDGTVEYSLTCPKDKVRSLVQHLVDAAMPGTVTAGMADEQQVMLSLRLKGL